jgi:hypothetical protein
MAHNLARATGTLSRRRHAKARAATIGAAAGAVLFQAQQAGQATGVIDHGQSAPPFPQQLCRYGSERARWIRSAAKERA